MGHKLQILEIFFCGHKLQIVEELQLGIKHKKGGNKMCAQLSLFW